MARGGVVPVDRGLVGGGVVVATAQCAPQLGFEVVVGHLEQAPDGRADQGDRVHGGHGVIEGRRVEDALFADQPGLFRRLAGHVEDPVGRLGGAKALAHVDEDGVGEVRPALGVIASDAGRVAPAGVEAVALDRLAIRETFEALEHHDDGDDRGRHRAASLALEEVGEGLVGEEAVALAMQEGVDRVLVEPLVAEPGHIVEQVTLSTRHTERHGPSGIGNYNDVILPDRRADRESSVSWSSVRSPYVRRHHPPRARNGVPARCLRTGHLE